MAGKRKFDLSKDVIDVDNKEDVLLPTSVEPRQPEKNVVDEKAEKEKKIYLSFHVTNDFKKEFRIWCAQRELNHSEALIEIFDKVKELDL